MRVYLAAPYAARAQTKDRAAELTRVGFTVTSSWLNEKHEIGSGTTGAATDLTPAEVAGHAATDLRDIDRSDLLVCLTAEVTDMVGGQGTSGGRHVETGYAIGKGLPVLVVGEPENVFHRLPRVASVVPSWHEAVIELAARLVADRSDRAVEVPVLHQVAATGGDRG